MSSLHFCPAQLQSPLSMGGMEVQVHDKLQSRISAPRDAGELVSLFVSGELHVVDLEK